VSQHHPNEISVDEARERINSSFSSLPIEDVAIAQSLGAVLAAPLVSSIDLPPFTNSAMDGYAVLASDIANASVEQVRLQIASLVAAGASQQLKVETSSTARIMTGAPLPSGADAVVPFEQTELFDAKTVSIRPRSLRARTCAAPGKMPAPERRCFPLERDCILPRSRWLPRSALNESEFISDLGSPSSRPATRSPNKVR
jgi:molybdopterin biosynthesis enzyme